MKLVFWLSLIGILYTYAAYPLLIALLARLRPRPWLCAPQEKTVSIVMAVHNGATLLSWKIEHLVALEPELVSEIIIVSDGSTDATNAILGATTDPRIRTIILPEQAGKSAALNHGIALAAGEILLFIDIRPRIEPGAVAALVRNFADPRVGCVAGQLLVQQSLAHEAAAATVGGLYWRYEQGIRNCEAAFDSPVGVYGGFYAARRALVHPAPSGLILDDMFHPLSIIRQGYRSVVDRSAIVLDTWPARTGDEFNRKVRTLAGNFQLFARAPWVLTPQNRVFFQFFSHKIMRLIVPYLLVLLLVSSALLARQSTFFAVLTVVQAIGWLLAILGGWYKLPLVHRIAGPANALLVLNAAAVVGLYKFLFTRGALW